MALIKVHRASPALDMTPMADLAFLLITFFMLTSCTKPQNPVAVDTPESSGFTCSPEMDLLTISVTKEGRVFFDVDGQRTRLGLIEQIGEKYNINFTKKEIDNFLSMPGFGVPIKDLQGLLNKDWISRLRVHQPGIPYDSLNNELADWVAFSKATNPKLRIAVNGDQNTDYATIKKVIKTLTVQDINRFNLITKRNTED